MRLGALKAGRAGTSLLLPGRLPGTYRRLQRLPATSLLLRRTLCHAPVRAKIVAVPLPCELRLRRASTSSGSEVSKMIKDASTVAELLLLHTKQSSKYVKWHCNVIAMVSLLRCDPAV